MRRTLSFSVLLLAAALPAQGSKSLRLPSGLELRLERVEGSRGLALMLFVKTGFAEDPPERTGLAHLLEHMVMTSGTPSRPGGWSYERWRRERTEGANAMTRPRWTVFYSLGTREECAADARWMGEVLAGKARFEPEALERERRRMLAEIERMTRVVPGGILQWRARARILRDRPEGRIGIGIPAEVRAIEIAELEALYRARYRNGNALLVAVGEVDPEGDAAFFKEVFGAERGGGEAGAEGVEAPPRTKGAPVPSAEDLPPAVGSCPRIGGVFRTFVFRTPSPQDPDYPAFLLAAFWMARKARMSFRPRGGEAAAFFLPALFPLLEAPELFFLNRRGESGATVEEVDRELETWLGNALRAAIPKAALTWIRQDLEGLLHPLPRSETRRRMLAKSPRLLYALALARGVAELRAFPGDLWKRIQGTTAAEVIKARARWFAPGRAHRLALVPR